MLKVVEAFSGIGAQKQALEKANIEHEIINTIEWDINAIYAYDIMHHEETKSSNLSKEEILKKLDKITLSPDGKKPFSKLAFHRIKEDKLQKLYAAILRNKNLCDITQVSGEMIPDDTDLLTYSFPCQDLSIGSAWYNKNNDGIKKGAKTRSGLLWEIERILKERSATNSPLPKFLLMENVVSRVVFTKNIHRLYISLVDDDPTTQEIFEIFSKDIVTSVEKADTEEEVLSIIAKRFKYWADLFKRPRGIYDEKWIQGFCGELWFLDNVLIDRIGSGEAIKSWTGPEKANQDFITSNKVFEIKTRMQQTNSIKISSDNQLSKNMYLAIIETSKSSEVAKESFNLYKLISSINTKIVNPKIHGEFNRKLLELGLFPLNNARVYDKNAYEFVSLMYYKINNDFPFIDHMSVPSAINKYSYELSIPSIDKFVISEEKVWS